MEDQNDDGGVLAQDDIDSLLGEAGMEGDDGEGKNADTSVPAKDDSVFSSVKMSNLNVRETMEALYSRAAHERNNDVTVIWNASGTLPMLKGYNMKIHDTDYVSIGTLYENHLVVKNHS